MRDVVERDVDLVERHAGALVVGETVQRELQHPLVLLGLGPGRAAGLPVDDLDATAAVFATIDRVELAHDVAQLTRSVEHDVDLAFDLDRLERPPLRGLERGFEGLEGEALLSRGLGVEHVVVVLPQTVVERRAASGEARPLLHPRVEQRAPQRLGVRSLGHRSRDRAHRAVIVADEVLETGCPDPRRRQRDGPAATRPVLGE